MPPSPNQQALPPTITPLPPLPASLYPTIPTTTTAGQHDLIPRQSIVTVSVYASSDSTSTSAASTSSSSGSSFPVKVAVPALIGGMALALIGFGLFLWLSKRRRIRRKEQWESLQRRQKKRAGTNTTRPSMSSSRSASNSKPTIMEKEHAPPVPPVPVLQKHQPPPQQEKSQYANNNYQVQAPIESVPAPVLAPAIPPTEPAPKAEYTKPPSKPRKAATRMAVAESAAATASADPVARYQPKKPSPLAVPGTPQPGTPGSPGYHLSPEEIAALASEQQQRLSVGGVSNKGRAVSGEWGVALGSPTHDDSFSQQQQQGGYEYMRDPYLDPRAKSGVYTEDPYAAYHGGDDEEDDDGYGQSQMDYHDAAKRGNWV
ncbi:hypothetical protein BCR39DRAFT_558269 [Naematelia encephala]|uniref:Uncharacterized protein n=1 Tax=Naematelia encephala TaxID=71784 RepID=A0A1Y2B8R5_9TREE|nr:hypothetical protein BCR39DRAFT_558269 [Naematelia encephala]